MKLAPDETPFVATGDLEIVKGFEDGEEMRIAGIVSSESRDADGEIVLQNGLEWDYFLRSGWFNDNHDSSAGAGLGVPRRVDIVRLPSGVAATRVEGVLFDTPESRRIFRLAKSARRHGRSLGFSIEGGIKRRTGDGNTVARAIVRDCAITRHAKNPDVSLSPLIKALRTGDIGPLAKAAATAGYGGPANDGGTADAIVPQSLDGTTSIKTFGTLSKSQAIAYIKGKLGCSQEKAEAIYHRIMIGGNR